MSRLFPACGRSSKLFDFFLPPIGINLKALSLEIFHRYEMLAHPIELCWLCSVRAWLRLLTRVVFILLTEYLLCLPGLFDLDSPFSSHFLILRLTLVVKIESGNRFLHCNLFRSDYF